MNVMECPPTCGAGSHCDPSAAACVPDAPDMAAPIIVVDMAHDLTMTCQPACAAGSYCNAGYHCVPCLDDSHCPIGQLCHVSGEVSYCTVGCKSDDRCRGGDAGAASLCCGGGCVDTSSDPSNCGACGTVCGSPNATGKCVAGKCQAGACNAGWGDCNGDPTDGCEASLRVDRKNCGKCGTVCVSPNGVAGCSDGCYLAACNFGYDDCNQDPSDGCEASVLSDDKNCGACANNCNPMPHGKAGCGLALCQVASCDQGWADCDGLEKTGCETSTVTDANNCGACNNKCGQGLICKGGGCTCPNCNIANASAKCINFVCLFDKCNPGFGDCDNNIKNGCETDLTADNNNCAACGKVCPMNAPNCINSSCMSGFTHHDGFGDTWIDNTPNNTYTIAEATSACNAYVMGKLGGNDVCILNGCGCGGSDLCVYNQKANPRYTWFYNNGKMGGEVTANCCGCNSMPWD